MSTPRFTADASLYTSSRTYQGAVSPGRSGAIIQLALDPCGCYGAYRGCMHACAQEIPPSGECIVHCGFRLDDCYSYCRSHRLLTLPPGVVGRLGP
jgi:hypothetical protein